MCTNTYSAPEEAGLHPLIKKFPIREYPTNDDYTLWFTGMRYRRYLTNPDLEENFSAIKPLRPALPASPAISHEYVEFIPIFEAVEECSGNFTMIDLGAGSGRWSMHAACIARSKGLPYRLIMVEAEPMHFANIGNGLRDNGMPEECCTCHEAAVIGDEDGAEAAEFPLIVRYRKFPNCEDPYNWRGQYVMRIRDRHKIQELTETYYGKQLFALADSIQFIIVPTITLNGILETHGKVDLVIMDIQGEEANVVRGAKNILNQFVGKIGIETHSPEIDREIKDILEGLGWEKVVDRRIGVKAMSNTEFFDQYLYYRNPGFQRQ